MSKQSTGKSGKSNPNAKQRREPDVQAQRTATKQARRQEQREEQRRQEQQRLQAKRQRRVAIIAAAVVAAVVVIAFVAYSLYNNVQAKSSGNTASTATSALINPNYPPVDGMACDLGTQVNLHNHAQLNIYINGKLWTIPANIGIATSGNTCLYWTHTHTSDGVIHMESPVQRTFTLGNFLDVWSKFPDFNYTTQLDDPTGWTAYVNGQPYSGDFHKIVLHEHTIITLAYNSPGIKPATSFNWGTL